VQARRPVGDFLAEVVRRTGLLAELDAGLDVQTALATRRNLAAFLDEVHGFSPLEGELTLAKLLEYVDSVESLERQEWSPVQPSEEDSVKVMTVHQAKGLEFEIVFVPGLAYELLPDMTIQQNPAERGYSLDFELRGDAEVLPRFDGTVKTFREDLQRQEGYEERRTFYVALTRAKRRSIVTGARWYGEGQRPKKKSIFFEELADWGESTGKATVDRGPETVDGDENPLIGYRQRFVREWPGPAGRPEADALFPQGWRRAAMQAASSGGQAELVETLEPEQRRAYETAAAARRSTADHLLRREADEASGGSAVRLPATLSVSGVIDYARCPKRFYWSAVRPLPRFSGPAARIGTEVHRWIELRARGQASLLDEETEPDLTVEELAAAPGKLARLKEAFEASRFANMTPLHAERAFLLTIEGFAIGGRIDAIYGTPDGPWEVVDYKTGRKPPEGDPLTGLQLDLYALACVEVFGKASEQLTLTYLYLADGMDASRPAGDTREIRQRLTQHLRGMAAGEFSPTPAAQCHGCDFRPFCEAGKAFVEERPG
jgi:DNA helicase-2/ATP-dependent DNA helicase PcrA